MQLHEILLIIVAFCISYCISGVVNSEIFGRRLNRGLFKRGFERLLKGSSIMKKVEHLEAKIDDPNFEKNVGKAVWESTRAEKGGTMKGIYAEQKEMLQDLGELGSFKHQNLLQMTKELDGLIENGLIKPEWGEKFLKWARIPRAQPFLDDVAKGVFEILDGDSNRSTSHGSGDQRWL